MVIVRSDGVGTVAPVFDGYPYLVTRIGHTVLRHHAVLPADWSWEALVEVAQRQVEANQLDSCVCLGPADAVYVCPGREPEPSRDLPTGLPVVGRLAIAGPIPQTRELVLREIELQAYAEREASDGFVVGDGLEGGREATALDLERWSTVGDDGLPGGLERCTVCGEARGEALKTRDLTIVGDRPIVVRVHCRCDNHNRCAGCGEPLYDHRLSAYYWDEEGGQTWYVAAYLALGHRCQDRPEWGT